MDARAAALDEQLKDYIADWRAQREKEQEELLEMKEKQANRKVLRAEEEKKMAERKKAEEERKQKEIEEKKQKEAEEKRRRLEEVEKKRQAMMAALKEQTKSKGPNFSVPKKEPLTEKSAELERNKTKEQLEEEKKISLSIRVPALQVENFNIDRLRLKAMELWDMIVKLETEKYDLEERLKRQEYDLKELKERQKQQLRHKALKRGLDPEALTGRYPPKIQVSSKYERRVDIRSYDDKKKLFEGGWETLLADEMEKKWTTRTERFNNRRRRTKLPKWFGERPGKKKDAPESPEEEEGYVEEEEIHHGFADLSLSLSEDDEEKEEKVEGEGGEGEEEEEDEDEEEESEEEDEDEESEEEDEEEEEEE